MSERRIRGRAVSATAAAPPPEPARHRAGRSGDSEIHPLPVIAALFLSPWCQLPLLLSAMFHPPSPPSPGSLHPSAPRLLPLEDDDGKYDGYDAGVLGRLVMHLLLLDTDTSITWKEEVKGKKYQKKEQKKKTRKNRKNIGKEGRNVGNKDRKAETMKRLVQKCKVRFNSRKTVRLKF